MKMRKTKLYNSLKNIMKVAFFMTLLLMFMQYGGMYVKYKNNNPFGNFYDFMTHEEREKCNPDLEICPSQRILDSIEDYEQIQRIIYAALFFFTIFELFSYLSNPKEHWIQLLMKRGEKIAEIHNNDK